MKKPSPGKGGRGGIPPPKHFPGFDDVTDRGATNYVETTTPSGGRGHWPKDFSFGKPAGGDGGLNAGREGKRRRKRQMQGCPAKASGSIRYCWDTTCLPPTRDQVGCTYTQMAALETSWCLSDGQFTPLSFQHAIDCNHLTYGCDGGWPYNVYWWLYYTNTTINEADYGYQGYQTECVPHANSTHTPVKLSTPYSFYYEGTDIDEGSRLIEVLLNFGSVVVGVYAPRDVWNFYGGGIVTTCGTEPATTIPPPTTTTAPTTSTTTPPPTTMPPPTTTPTTTSTTTPPPTTTPTTTTPTTPPPTTPTTAAPSTTTTAPSTTSTASSTASSTAESVSAQQDVNATQPSSTTDGAATAADADAASVTTLAPSSNNTANENSTAAASDNFSVPEAPSTTTVAPSNVDETTATAAAAANTEASSSTTTAPSTTTAAPSTSTAAPSSTTAAPSSTTAAPSSTTAAPSSTTAAPTTTTTTTTTAATEAPTTTTQAPSSTTDAGGTGLSGSTLSVKMNHAVVIVGDGMTADGTEFWVILNSWGTSWGQGGYILVKKGVCNIGAAIFQPIPAV
ncbi:PREDICTED: cell wall protein DAN4-like [Priapulus caudatus]|uniref:Cell wall protein DAN4-like n=1 Tax=Priapulus caudatus TaxID=37621 RepID=A0ABM1F230_PRICU|nr:PREDICTED: cell wall protein DAN4-like [Priapulus caudatus]